MNPETYAGGAVRASSNGDPVAAAWSAYKGSGGADEYNVDRHGRLVSAGRAVAGLAVETFLRAAAGQERFFWRDGRQGNAFAGMGVAAHLMGYGRSRFAAIQRQAGELFGCAAAETDVGTGPSQSSTLARPLLFGGFAFRETFTPDEIWTGFHPAHFILPHFQLVTQGEQSWLTINTLLPPEEDVSATLPLLQEALDVRLDLLHGEQRRSETGESSAESTNRVVDRPGVEIEYPLPYEAWARMIKMAQHSFATTPLEKVVLSRIAQMRARKPIGVLPALTHLCSRYPGCFSFLFEPQPGHAFLGATPELLARVQGQALETMALAGSIQRGASESEDAAFAGALLASSKDRHEHELVVRALRELLAPLSNRLEIEDEPAVLPFSNIQHLCTPVRARLKGREGALAMVNRLHPTPAMGGTPYRQALDFIQENEPTLRGWYAAPVGWIDNNMDGAFAVAIRSGVVQNRRAWAYAGAGIVADSVAEKEWEETGWKFQPFISSIAGKQ